jgi:hypothetical protein
MCEVCRYCEDGFVLMEDTLAIIVHHLEIVFSHGVFYLSCGFGKGGQPRQP